MSTNDESSIKNVAETLSTALASSDTQSAQRLQMLSLVHRARLSQLTRNVAVVTRRYGAKSPQTTAAQAAVANSNAVVVRIEVVSRQLNTPLPDVPAGGWVLHGHVYDELAATVAGQTVFLVDVHGEFRHEYGFAYTDDTGYFMLTADGPAAGADTGSKPSTPPAAPELYLEVTNEKRQPVYLSSTAFNPTVGTATYVAVHLATGRKPIGDPPSAIRGTALPTATPSSAKRTQPKAGGSTGKSR